MARKKSKQPTAENVMTMWDCVLWHLAEIQWSMLEALRELGSDDPFIEKLRPLRWAWSGCANCSPARGQWKTTKTTRRA